MTLLRWPALALALVSGAAGAGHFTFQDWEVACDNTRRCEAAGYQREDQFPPIVLWLARAPGADAPVRAKFVPMTEDGEEAKGPLTVRIGQVTVRGVQANAELAPEQVAKMLPPMLNAGAAQVTAGQRTWTLSLAGMKAALLKLDDVQGRVGTPTALAMPGARPAGSVLPALPAPVVRPLPAVAARKDDARLLAPIVKTLAHGGCENDGDIADDHRDNSIHRLSASQVLLVLECGRGAYQSSYELWTASDRPPYRAKRVKVPDSTGGDGYVMNPSFEDNRLSSMGKGRGIFDCGAWATWAWTAAGFQLIEASSAQQCRGFAGGYTLPDYTATVVQPGAR